MAYKIRTFRRISIDCIGLWGFSANLLFAFRWQYASFGKYGTFELEISADDGTMTWKSNLANIDELAEELGIEGGIPSLNYHLHQAWTIEDADFAIGGEACGPSNTGGHYDPFFAVSTTDSRTLMHFNASIADKNLRCCFFINSVALPPVFLLTFALR